MMGSTSGTLRVPVHIHDLKTSANQIRAREYRSNGENPSLAYIAAEMGVTERRLRGIEQVTRGPLSIDTAVGSGPQRGSGAGEGSASPDGLWSDTVIDAEWREASKAHSKCKWLLVPRLTSRSEPIIVSESRPKYNSVTCPAHSKSLEQLELERLSLCLSTKSPRSNALSVKFNTTVLESKPLLHDTGEFADTLSFVTEDVLGLCGANDDFRPHWGGADLYTGVTIFTELAGKELV